MLKVLQKIVEVYVFSNLHISIAAGIYVLGAYALLGFTEPYAYVVPTMIAIGTFITYNAHRYIGRHRISDTLFPQRISFVHRYRFVIGFFSVLALFPIGFFLFKSNPGIWLMLVPCVLLTFLYLVPVFPGQKRLRDLPWIKIIIIATVWSGLFLLPLFTAQQIPYIDDQSILIFIEKFFFFIGITIPFDYRDQEIDRRQGVVTIATQFKLHELKIGIVASFSAAILAVISLSLIGTYNLGFCLGLGLLYLISIALSLGGIRPQQEIYYLGILDGLILLSGLCYFL